MPGLRGRVSRWQRLRYQGVDGDGQPVDRCVEGFHARVVQHECDHLDGVLFPDRLSDHTAFGFIPEFRDRRADSNGPRLGIPCLEPQLQGATADADDVGILGSGFHPWPGQLN